MGSCENRGRGEPSGYIQWHQWAEKKSKRHKQVQCPKCKRWHTWIRKNPTTKEGTTNAQSNERKHG